MSEYAAIPFDQLFGDGPKHEAPCAFCQKTTRSHALAVIPAGETLYTFELNDPDRQLNPHTGREMAVGIICHSCWRKHEIGEHLESGVVEDPGGPEDPIQKALEAFNENDDIFRGVVGR